MHDGKRPCLGGRRLQPCRSSRLDASVTMWCSSCQQDVPAVASPDETSLRCARCRQSLNSDREPMTAGSSNVEDLNSHSALERSFAPPPLPCDDWELETDLRSALRIVNLIRHENTEHQPLPVVAAASPPTSRIDTAHESPEPAANLDMRGSRQRVSLFTWALLSLGVMTFVCGGVLVAWSFAADRADLRTIGMPLTLAGQAALIIGLVMQLEGLWQSSRQTRQTLCELDCQLHELRHATTLLTSSHSTPSQSFYAHMAEGASPQLLLADLKGQMDLLAQRMASQRRVG